MKNGNMIIPVRADTHRQTSYYDSSSGTTVMGLNKGDNVSVVAIYESLYISGYSYTYWSGFLLS